ncbi:hypothetical protein NDU88_005141 [Pleurodeles waltl]|uniref:Uncharacterized protein n=1 Tax=Pleurodeles waltl TaxID=8319 RepID=A0AAV7LNP9_PLEWA|nr:hypothetical protein NDU88_005141 [Pleurodeles waltl]
MMYLQLVLPYIPYQKEKEDFLASLDFLDEYLHGVFVVHLIRWRPPCWNGRYSDAKTYKEVSCLRCREDIEEVTEEFMHEVAAGLTTLANFAHPSGKPHKDLSWTSDTVESLVDGSSFFIRKLSVPCQWNFFPIWSLTGDREPLY